VTGAGSNARLRVKITDYPLWRVQAVGAGGAPGTLAHSADDLGLMEVPLPAGSYDLKLRYRPGVAEHVGAGISVGVAVLWLFTLLRHLLRAPGRAIIPPWIEFGL
jgi:hypothetical protein